MRSLFIAALLVTPAFAADPFDVKIDNFYIENGLATAIVRVINQTGKDARNVFVNCVFMTKEGRALDIGPAQSSFIPAGGVAYNKASITRTADVEKVHCAVVQYRD